MIEVAQSFMTEEFIVCAYTYLVQCKVKMVLGGSSELAEGCLDGYICCLEDMFGQATDEAVEKASEEKRSLFHVLDRIITYMKPAIVATKADKELTIELWVKIQDIVKQYVRDYVIDNYDDCLDGLQSI